MLSLDGWGDIAQFVIAGSGFVALIGAGAQLSLSRANARRSRVYEYADRFNTPEMLRRTADYREYWDTHNFEHFMSLDLAEQLERLLLPNLVEEVALLYNRKLLDREVASELLGVYVERLWEVSRPLVDSVRLAEKRPTIYSEWEQMQRDTPTRRARMIDRNKQRLP
jgi:hypothetical protein